MTKNLPPRPEPAAQSPAPQWAPGRLPARVVRRVLDAVVAVTSDLDLDVVLRQIVRSAMDLTRAGYGALGIRDGDQFGHFVHIALDESWIGHMAHPPRGSGLLGELIANPRPIRVANIAKHPRSSGFPPGHPTMRSFLGVPVVLRDTVFGNLYLTNKENGATFTASDESAVVALASAAGAAIENARLYSQAKQVGVLEDRDRIARDLHDVVIQRLFASAMSLMSIKTLVTDPTARERIEETVSDLDETIGQIRSTIFALHTATDPGAPSIEDRLRAAAQAATTTLGFAPEVRVDLDPQASAAIPATLAHQLVVALGEALTNVARHAKASVVVVHLAVTSEQVRLTVSDNGVGIGPGGRRSGLRNLAARARAFEGECTAEAGPQGGTTLTWWARPV